jgi:uncharacterized membrane protein YfcA
MDPLEALAILLAGIGAGAINTVVGSGTLITFPVLLALGYQPLIANVSNNIGLVPGGVAGAYGYRRELERQRPRALHLAGFSVAGGIAGATLLLVLPSSAFDAIVPALIALALVLVVAQPRINRAVAERRDPEAHRGAPARLAVGASGVYGGYFGAGQGILLMGILGVAIDDTLQRLNGLKNVLAATVNLTAGAIFVFAADVDWGVAGLIAAGSIAGAVAGARYGRRLSPTALRALIVVVGTVAIVRLLVT